MAETTYFPRRLILAGAMISGVLLALAVHMLGARFGLDLGGLWRSDTRQFMPAGSADRLVADRDGRFLRRLFHRDADGQRGIGTNSAADAPVPDRGRRAGAGGRGQAASAPSPIPTISGVLAGLAALCLGAAMAFCGAHFALRKA
jgi:hypothetical protein